MGSQEQSGRQPEDNIINLEGASKKPAENNAPPPNGEAKIFDFVEESQRSRKELERQAGELAAKLEEMKTKEKDTREKYEACDDPPMKDQLFRHLQYLKNEIHHIESLLAEADHLKKLAEKA